MTYRPSSYFFGPVLRVFGMVGGVLASVPAYSASTDPDADDIIVSATRRSTLSSEVGSTVTLIEADEIEARQYQFVADALALSPGVSVARNSAFGGVASVNIRGSSSRQSLVVIDGIVVNDPSAPGGSFNFANLDVADIDRIEVLRGPQSILYGSEAIGGVISITTKRSDQRKQITAFAEGGSFATLRSGVNAIGRKGAFDYRVSAYGIRTDGISRADEDDGNTENDGFRSIATSANFGLALDDNIRLESIVRYGTSATELDGFPPPNFALADSDDRDSSEEVALSGRLIVDLLDKRFNNQLSVSYSDIERNNFSGDTPTFGAQGDRLSFDYIGQFDAHDRVLLIVGAESEETTIDTGDIVDAVRINSVFGLAELSVIQQTATTLTVTGGVRYDDHETFGGVTTARFTGALARDDLGLVLRGSWGQAFSAPSLFQLNATFGPGPANRDLLPETANGWDVGIEKQFLSDIGRLSVTWFNQSTENLIDFNFATGAFFNIAQSRQRGVEAALNIKLHQQIGLTSAYTYTDAIDLATALQVLRQPRHKLVSNLDWTPTEKLNLSLGVTYNGRERDSFAPIESFVRLDLRGRYILSERLELFARIENLTDTNYQDVAGFGEPGLSVFGGIRVRFAHE